MLKFNLFLEAVLQPSIHYLHLLQSDQWHFLLLDYFVAFERFLRRMTGRNGLTFYTPPSPHPHRYTQVIQLHEPCYACNTI